MQAETILLPNNWEPRHYQLPVLDHLDSGVKRALSVWHRRAGKDSAALNHTAKAAFDRVGTYWHLFPEQKQARRAIWNGIDREGRRIIDQAFPPAIRTRTLEQEMMIEFVNGSTWQLVGSDCYDSLVGTNPVGVIFSEYALSDPQAWDYIRPILAENEGWAWFISTPRGKNHFYQMKEMALRNEAWYIDILGVLETGFDLSKVEAERQAGMSEALIRQEYYCSFEEGGVAQFIPQGAIEDAIQRNVPPGQPRVMGVDVARFGDDRTCVVYREGNKHMWTQRWQGIDTMQTASRVAEFIQQFKPHGVFIDDVGVGSGVTDRLRQLGHNVFAVNAGRSPTNVELYKNLRAEMYGRMREWLADKGDIRADDLILANDLAMVEYKYDAQNRIQLEKKEDMKKRGLPSPDVSDALSLTFAEAIIIPEVKRYAKTQVNVGAAHNPHDMLYAGRRN